MKNNDKDKKPATYPLPSETDKQLKDQPEYIDQQPNDFNDRSISDLSFKNEEQEKDPVEEHD